MQEDRRQPPELRCPSELRRYVYRSVQPHTGESHPLRRSTDRPRRYQEAPTPFYSEPQMLHFRIYLKVN